MKMLMIVLAVAMVGCTGGKNSVELLKNRNWQLQSVVNNGETLENPQELPVLNFADSSKVSGTAGCNSFFGSYEASNEGDMSFKLGGTTMMYCPDMSFETEYLKLLTRLDKFVVDSKTLSIKSADGKIVINYTLQTEE